MTRPDALRDDAGTLAPVVETQRVHAVDTLRGFALLGILMMNITAFAMPGIAYVNPMLPGLERYGGAFEGTNRATWLVVYLLFDLKMMTIFSMLFGAGLVLMAGRAGAGRGFAGVFYRRLGWLFVIGMIHAYLIWYGDILVAYALCGLALYPLRNLKPAWLLALGGVLLLVGMAVSSGFGAMLVYLRHAAEQAQAALDAGTTISEDQKGMLDGWRQTQPNLAPPPEKIDEFARAIRGSWAQAMRVNAQESVFFQTVLFALMTLWRSLGCMLVGMGLMKLGVFAAARSGRFYAGLMLAGYGVGLPLAGVGVSRLLAHRFDMPTMDLIDGQFNYVGSLLVALGHVGLVMTLVRRGALGWLTARLAAVGRMALSNYLSHSLLCTFLFWGWGLGLFGKVDRLGQAGIVVGIWVLTLLWSPWWLARFRFGPAEWAWRSLTYGRRQPMRAGGAGGAGRTGGTGGTAPGG
jgi:uncharacterized protein